MNLNSIMRLLAACWLGLGVAGCVPDVVYDDATGQFKGQVVEGDITGNVTWTFDQTYILKGFVRVRAGATLTIEAGTVIRGDKATKGSLIVERGGVLVARGTAESPIVFTSNEPVGNRNIGDWGGIIICGRAPINVAGGQAEVEGGVGAQYGGNDPDDYSGVLSYVRIEFSGIAFQPNREINGLTLAGVGRRTQIDHIMVAYCGDDSFEWFGGTVDARYLVSYHSVDDDFDSDNGFSGNNQFLLAIRDPQIADVSGSNGFESDNDASGSQALPTTTPTFSQVTVVGPLFYAQSYNSNFRRGAHLRRSTQCSIFNTLFVGYPTGLFIDGGTTAQNAQNAALQLRNSTIIDSKNALEPETTPAFDARTWFLQPAFGNRIEPADELNGLFRAGQTPTTPDFRPLNPRYLTGARYDSPRLDNPFFERVAFQGAFGETDWTQGWCNFQPQTTVY
jgi:hypothetical protein